jgi:hypothetical protein
MRYRSQRVITSASGRINLSDESVHLHGSAPQTITIDGSGAGAASPGAVFRLVNDCDHDATFVPGAPQTVSHGASLIARRTPARRWSCRQVVTG